MICVGPAPVRTEVARRLLPDLVPHRDAAANAGRSALLVAALTQLPAEPGTLLAATRDWLHQDYRAGAMPETAALHRQAPGGRHPGRRVRGRAVRAGPAGAVRRSLIIVTTWTAWVQS